MTTKAQQRSRERDEAVEAIREWIAEADVYTVRTILRHVSQSGMTRVIDPVLIVGKDTARGRTVIHLGWQVAKALGLRYDRNHEGIRISGAGMDMGFYLVYNLSRTLWPNGYPCIGEDCPANDHFNGDRDYTPGHTTHRDGGYRLSHRWL